MQSSPVSAQRYALSPVDERRTRHWKVYIAFWERAARDPLIAEMQRRQIDLARSQIARIVRARNGERLDLESVADRLNAVVQGLAIQALMDEARWPPERIGARLAEEVEAVLGPDQPLTLSAARGLERARRLATPN